MSFSAEIEIVRCAVFHLSAELQCAASPPVREDPGSLWTQRLTSIELDPRRDFHQTRPTYFFVRSLFAWSTVKISTPSRRSPTVMENSAAGLSQVLDEDTSTSSFGGVL